MISFRDIIVDNKEVDLMNDKNDNELEKTIAIEDLADIIPEENLTNEDTEPVPVMETSREEQNDEMYKELEEEKLTKIEKLKRWWKNLEKKNKILIISLLVIALLFIIVLIIFLFSGDSKEDTGSNNSSGDKPDEVIVMEDNYIYKDGVLSLLNSRGDEIGTYECTNKEEKLCYVAYNSLEDSFDEVVNVYENGELVNTRSEIKNDSYVFIFDNIEGEDLITLYDIKNKSVVDKYQLVKDLDYDDKKYSIVKNKEGKYGLYEFSEDAKVVIDYTYDYLGYLKGKYLVFTKNGSYGLVDFSNKEVAKNIDRQIKSYNDNYIVVADKNGRNYQLLKLDGTTINNEKYDFISLYDDYYGYVDDDLLYFKDYNLDKLYEEGISLYDEDYVGKKIYNEDGVKIKEESSFSVSIIGNNLNIEVSDGEDKESIVVDVRDKELSKKLKFYSYYGGKLYFYEDEGKTKLLGSYPCNNKNDVEKGSVSTCKLAFDTVYEDNYTYVKKNKNATVPIINNRFVFVYDSPLLSNESNQSINLYDLKDDKNIVTYRSINSHTSDNGGVASHKVDADFRVMAQNVNGKYGMISVSLTQAIGVYGFDYDYMEKISSTSIAVKTGDYWSIINSSGTAEGNYPGRIMSMVGNYVVAKISNSSYKVKLYDMNSNPIGSETEGFDYISVGNKYFGGVKNGKVYVYALNGGVAAGNPDGYTVNFTDYITHEKPVFKFSTSLGSEYIDILNSDGSYESIKIESEEE